MPPKKVQIKTETAIKTGIDTVTLVNIGLATFIVTGLMIVGSVILAFGYTV